MLVVRDGDSIAVFGEEAQVQSYLDRVLAVASDVGQATPISVQSLGDVAAGASAVAALGALSGSLMVLTPGSVALVEQLGAIPDGAGAFHTFVKKGHQISNQLRFTEVSQTGAQLASLQLAVATVSLRTAIKGVQDAVDRVESKVDIVTEILESESIANVVSQHRFLQRLVDNAAVTSADWDVIGPLGQPIHASTERLQRRLLKMAEGVDLSDDAAGRAKALGRLVEKSRLPETLALLLVARQAEFLWHTLRLQRIADTEPERLGSAKQYAEQLVRYSLEADRQLVERLDSTLTEAADLRPLEVLRKISGARLESHLAALRQALADFAAARAITLAQASRRARPTVADAVDELQIRSDVGRLRLSQARAQASDLLKDTSSGVRDRVAERRHRDRRDETEMPRLFQRDE